jgi:hypothetical protein
MVVCDKTITIYFKFINTAGCPAYNFVNMLLNLWIPLNVGYFMTILGTIMSKTLLQGGTEEPGCNSPLHPTFNLLVKSVNMREPWTSSVQISTCPSAMRRVIKARPQITF